MGLFVDVRSWKWGDECVGYYAKNYHLTIHFWGLSAKCWNVEAWGGFLCPNLRWNRGFLIFFFVFTFIFEDYFGWKIQLREIFERFREKFRRNSHTFSVNKSKLHAGCNERNTYYNWLNIKNLQSFLVCKRPPTGNGRITVRVSAKKVMFDGK